LFYLDKNFIKVYVRLMVRTSIYDVKLNIWINKKMKVDLQKVAKEEGRTVSDMIRSLLIDYLGEKHKKNINND